MNQTNQSILTLLKEESVWKEFYRYKTERNHLSKKDAASLDAFIREKKYLPAAEKFTDPDYILPLPTKFSINKSGTGKKRVVYTFPETESMLLKLIAHLLYRYDALLSPACYSFRKNISAKDAIRDILAVPGLSRKFCLKADISNYFNSMSVDILLSLLHEILTDDPSLYHFFEKMLLAGAAYENGTVTEEMRGAMAGTPTSAFFADLYLLSVDESFTKKGVPYFRYSDDILIFADSMEELSAYQAQLTGLIHALGLSMNPDKLTVTAPGEAFEFLGFCCRNGQIDLSKAAKRKMKAKIKRKAHLLYRRQQKNNGKKTLTFEESARLLIKTFNRKYFEEEGEDRFTWSRWFFPVLTCSDGLKELDEYLLSYVRFLKSGRHYKGNYRLRYESIKELGYRSLVHEYYRYKNLSFPAKYTMIEKNEINTRNEEKP